MIGLYIHVPFCVSKCPYCDFYSLAADETAMDAYTAAAVRAVEDWGRRLHERADTLYFGGGTPSLLGPSRLTRLIEAAAAAFGLQGAEITLEANPADELAELFSAFAAAGGNRLSVGMQAADDGTLRRLGRRHTAAQTIRTAEDARRAGINNLSLDLMLAVPGQTVDDIERATGVLDAVGATHASAYLLKREPDTPFGRHPPAGLPDDDAAAALYLAACEALERRGYKQYEISNFAREGCQSRHNLKYWNSDPYLGIGPSAHSFVAGRRFAYPRSLAAFLAGEEPLPEDPDDPIADAGPEEYALLRLRLTEGLTEAGYRERFGAPLPAEWRRRAAALPPGLVLCDSDGIRLTRRGFLVSNAVLASLL